MEKNITCPHCGEENYYDDFALKKKIHFIGHEFKSADIARQIMNRLKYPNDVIDAVVVSVKNHMRTKQYGKQAELVSDKELRKLMFELGDHLENMLELVHADNVSHGDETQKWKHNIPQQVAGIRQRNKELGDFSKLNVPLNGEDIIKLIQQKVNPDFNPDKNKKTDGPLIGKLTRILQDKYLENPNITKQDAEKFILGTYKTIQRDPTAFKKFDKNKK